MRDRLHRIQNTEEGRLPGIWLNGRAPALYVQDRGYVAQYHKHPKNRLKTSKERWEIRDLELSSKLAWVINQMAQLPAMLQKPKAGGLCPGGRAHTYMRPMVDPWSPEPQWLLRLTPSLQFCWFCFFCQKALYSLSLALALSLTLSDSAQGLLPVGHVVVVLRIKSSQASLQCAKAGFVSPTHSSPPIVYY